MEKHTVYIEFLNKEKGFTPDQKSFIDYNAAREWANENLESFDPDMIKYFD